MKENKYTPMMEQYLEVKEANPDTILFYRIGDFYEMFFEDAKIASRELDLVLTGKNAGKEEKVPMCGIPHHAANSYIQRLIKKGYKVSICEQLEDPAQAKGIVKRGIIRTITPGTYMDEALDAKASNYLASVVLSSWNVSIIYCELSTGELKYQTLSRSLVALEQALMEQNVSEVVVEMRMDKRWINALEEMETFIVSRQKKATIQQQDQRLLPNDASTTLQDNLAQLMAYLKETQKQHIEHFMPMESMDAQKVLVMDYQTKNHLDLVHGSKGLSLWSFMDRCQSAMGSRLLRNWIEMPLIEANQIAKRQQAIKTLNSHMMLRDDLKEQLVYIYDMERLASRMAYGNASARDVQQLTVSL